MICFYLFVHLFENRIKLKQTKNNYNSYSSITAFMQTSYPKWLMRSKRWVSKELKERKRGRKLFFVVVTLNSLRIGDKKISRFSWRTYKYSTLYDVLLIYFLYMFMFMCCLYSLLTILILIEDFSQLKWKTLHQHKVWNLFWNILCFVLFHFIFSLTQF